MLGALAFLSSASAQTWSFSGAFASGTFRIACSADGSRAIALSPGVPWTFVTTNYGISWESNSVPAEQWSSLAASADGLKVVASTANWNLYTSTNGGLSWNMSTIVPPAATVGSHVASSADGTKLVALMVYHVDDDLDYGRIYTSANSGASWTLRLEDMNGFYGNTAFASAASSADGTKLFGASYALTSGSPFPLTFPGNVLWSTTSGTTWFGASPFLNWSSIASSASGNKLVAGAANSGGMAGSIQTSVDGGQIWTSNNVPKLNWSAVASSADGTKLLAASTDGRIYTSTDSGDT